MFKDKFKMNDRRKLSHFLGIDFEKGDGCVKISQKEYIQGAPIKKSPRKKWCISAMIARI